MKLSTVFTAFVVVLPLFSGQALAAATQGNKGNGQGAKNNAASKNASSNKTGSNNAASNKAGSNKAASNNTVSNNAASNNTGANNAASANNGNAQDSLSAPCPIHCCGTSLMFMASSPVKCHQYRVPGKRSKQCLCWHDRIRHLQQQLHQCLRREDYHGWPAE